jgi:hypothetical protein
MSPLSIATFGRALAVATCVAVAACGSTSVPNPPALPSSTAPDLASNAATPLDIATSSSAPASAMPTATAATMPPKPTGVTFTTDVAELARPSGTAEITYQAKHTVRWKDPRTAGVEIRVYGVTECLSEPSDPLPATSGPCLVEHTVLPGRVMVLAATAPAAAGEISWIAPMYYECAGPPVGPDGLDYRAIVIAAYSAAGHSIFAIADPGEWWHAGPDEVIC